MGLKEWIAGRERKKQLKKQIETDISGFGVLLKQAQGLAEELPEGLRKAGKARLVELGVSFKTAREVSPKDREKKALLLSQLLEETQQVINKFKTDSLPPTRPRSGATVTPPPVQVQLDFVRQQLEQAQAIAEHIDKAGLPVPPVLAQPIASVERLFTSNAAPEAFKPARAALQQALNIEDDLQGFVVAWTQGDIDEKQTRSEKNDIPGPLKLAVEIRWNTGRNDAKQTWQGLADVSTSAVPAQRLSQLQDEVGARRKNLVQWSTAVKNGIDEVQAKLQELSLSNLYELDPARGALQLAREKYEGATADGDLNTALKDLDRAREDIARAQKNIQPSQLEALAAFNKLRNKLNEQILKAQGVRGALTEGSPVKKLIDEALALRSVADLRLSRALLSSQVEKACEPLQLALDKKIGDTAESLAKKLKEQSEADTDALPDYQKAFADLRQARAEVAALPGAQKVLNTLDLLIAETQVDGSGTPKGGFAQALKRIQDANVAQLLKDAQVVSGKHIDESLNSFDQQALQMAQDALARFGKVHTAFELNAQREALPIAAVQPQALSKLNAYTTELNRRIEAQQKYEQVLRSGVEEVIQKLHQLVSDGTPPEDPALAVMTKKLKSAQGMLDQWSLTDAQGVLDDLADTVLDAETDLARAKKEWTVQLKLMGQLRDRALPLKDAWGGIATFAAGVEKDADHLWSQVEQGKLDLRTAVEQARAFVTGTGQRLDQMLAAINLDPSTDFASFREEAKRLDREWNEAVAPVKERIDQLDRALKTQGVAGGAATMGWPKKLADLQTRWRDMLDRDLSMGPGETPEVALGKLKAALLISLNMLRKELPDPDKTDDPAFKQQVEQGKDVEAKAAWRVAFNKANQLYLELQSADVKLPPEVTRRLGVFDESTVSAEKAQQWAELAKELGQLVLERRRDIVQRKVPTWQAATRLKNRVAKKLLDRQSVTFEGLFSDLGQRIDDALAMLLIEPPDTTLIAAAEQQIAEITNTLDDAKGKGIEGAVTLDRVQEVWAELAEPLGKNNCVMERLPDTYKRLKTKLDATIEISKRSPPDQSLAELEKLRAPILEAREQAVALQVRYEGFKELRKATEEKFAKMKDHTGSTLGNRTKAYNERLTARLNEAHALARQEGQLDAALKLMGLIDQELSGMLAQPKDEARLQVLKLDAEQQQEQRELRDLARTWNATQTYWEETLLPEVEKAVKKRKDEEDNSTEFESLKAAVLNIGKTLEPYLALVSAVPHKRYLANGAPDMKVAKGAFSQAYMRLSQLNKTALRLRDGTGSTNVDLVSDLNKLEQEWTRRVADAAQALVQLSNDVKKLPSLAKPGVDDPDHLPEDALQTLKGATEKLGPQIEQLSSRFTAQAFSRPFGVLRSGTSTPAERKQAREEALRTVRQLRADVADNALFQKVFEGTRTGMLGVDIRPQIAFLQAGLKKIELAALVGI